MLWEMKVLNRTIKEKTKKWNFPPWENNDINLEIEKMKQIIKYLIKQYYVTILQIWIYIFAVHMLNISPDR